MSDHKDAPQIVADSARKALFEALLKNVVLKQFFRVVGGLLSSLVSRKDIDAMDPISISSSDDDSVLREIDEYVDESPLRDAATSSSFSFPPLWQSTSSGNLGVNGGPSHGVSSPKRPFTSDGSSSNFTSPTFLKPDMQGDSSRNLGAFNSRTTRDNNFENHTNNVNGVPAHPFSSTKRPFTSNGGSSSGNVGALHSRTSRYNDFEYHPNNANGGSSRPFSSAKRPFTYGGSSNSPILKSEMPSGNVEALHSNTARDNNSENNANDDYDWAASKRAKRTLPTSFQTSMAGRKNFVDTSSRQFRLNYDIGRGRANEDVVMHENKGSRVLPPSLAHGRPASSNSYGNMSGSSHYTADVEEDPRGTDERILFQAALKDLNETTAEIDVPKGILSVSLLRHQKIALAWLIEKEKRGQVCMGGFLADDQGLGKTVSMIALIQMERSSQDKHKSEAAFIIKPEALNLEDDEDIIVANAPIEVKPKVEIDDKEEILKASGSNRKPAAGTLVICPASVLRQWARELDEKVTEEAKLSVLMYHGSNRTRDPVELAKYDVVLTTYAIASMEVPKQPLVDEDNDQNLEEKYGLSSEFSVSKKHKKTSGNRKGKGTHSDASDCGALAKVRWFRIILDEAQTIKNHRTQVARACCSLRAKRRWCLSGTPIQNAIDELFSYFRFLRHAPYSNYKKFVVGIRSAISRNSNHGYMRLQCVLKGIMLRRTKATLLDGKPIITLPPKTIHLTKVDFSPEESAFYNKLEAESRSQFKAYAAAGTVKQNYANILLLLLRLRQACDHPLLVKGFSSDVAGRAPSKIAKSLPIQKLRSLLGLLETSLAICGVCNDPPENAVVTICGHVFCFQCVSDYLTGEDTTCPEAGCKEQVSADVIFTKATLKKCLSDDFSSEPSGSSRKDEKSTVLTNKCSSKIKAVLQILESYCKPSSLSSEMNELVPWDECTSSGYGCDSSQNSKPTKAIVFSQWTGMLDLVEKSLGNTSIEYRRLDGTMSLAARDKAVKDFNTKPEVTVMLMSLKAGNLGLNMVAACHVILLDLWWNPTTEDQAVDRAHRIGQTCPVTVTRLTIKNTVEDRILALQEEKRKMVASAFGEDQSGGFATRLSMEDLRNLFNVRRDNFPLLD